MTGNGLRVLPPASRKLQINTNSPRIVGQNDCPHIPSWLPESKCSSLLVQTVRSCFGIMQSRRLEQAIRHTTQPSFLEPIAACNAHSLAMIHVGVNILDGQVSRKTAGHYIVDSKCEHLEIRNGFLKINHVCFFRERVSR